MYKFETTNTALGIEHKFVGPGMSQYIGVHFMQPMNDWANKCLKDGDRTESDAQRIANMLHDAYEAGKRARSKEIAQLIGQL